MSKRPEDPRGGFSIQCWQHHGTCLESMYIQDGYSNDEEMTIKVIGDDLVEIKCLNCGRSIVVRGDSNI